jgi:HEAT repeat protein
MGFDFQNFGLGLLTGWATGYGVYRARHLITRTVQSVSQQASSAQNYATQSADNRYINDLISMAESSHIAGRFAKLSDIIIEPRFIASPPLPMPADEDDVTHDVFHVVPLIHDFPYLHAPYNIETLSIDDLGTGERKLALLARPGSGRTTALLAIALKSLGHITFEAPSDKIQQRLEAEEAKLSDKQRAVRIQERLTIEQRAKERLAEERGVTFDAGNDPNSKSALPLFNRLMPVYVHLADVDPQNPEFSNDVDPAEPLVRAIQRQVGRITASTLPRKLYRRLSQGQVLLLVDGYDDLPEVDRVRQSAWLQALMTQYPDNFFIVAGPINGYGGLLRLGLTPVFLRPWMELDSHRAADKWAEAWPRISGTRRNQAARPDMAAVDLNKTNNRALSQFDFTLKIWANYAKDTEAVGFEGWLRSYLARHLPKDQSLGLILPQIAQAAALQLDEGYIIQKRLEEIMVGQVVAPIADTTVEPDEPNLDEGQSAKKAKGKKKGEEEKEDSSAQAKLLAILRRSGLLVRYTGGRHQFKHTFIAAYLASLTLKDADPRLLATKASLPAWKQAWAYAALHTSVEAAARARLNAPADILQDNILEIANWLPYASVDAPWRAPVLRQLATIMIMPAQYPLIRERATAALVCTRDANVAQIFSGAIRSKDAHIRRLACLGLGAIGDEQAIGQIEPLLQDKDETVQLAAGMALGGIGTETALTTLVEAFTEGSEQLRQAIAETLAATPDEGYPVLYDAIHDEEMMLRRAAVFGLRRVKTPWSLLSIYRAFLEDEQWYVRSAAQLAFQELQEGVGHGPKAYPHAASLTWLANWAAKRGENIPPGEGANQVLLKALQEGETPIRMYAAATLGQLGVASTVKPLYSALRDKQADVREAAHRALAHLQLQIGQALPSPV